MGRGAAAASFATFFAAFSHAAAGSTAPGAVGVVIAFAFAVLVCTALAGRRLTVPRLVVAVVTSQALFHILFGVGAGGVDQDWSAHLGHHGEVIGVLPAVHAIGAAEHTGHDGAWMWVAHAAAAAATLAVALWGARLVAAATALLGDGLRIVLARAAELVPVDPEAPARRALPVVRTPEWTPHARLLLGRMRHRGPPARLALATALA